MTEPLKLNSRQGDFVHANQQMASKEGFAFVSRLWWEKTIPLSEGIDKIDDEVRTREDILAPAKVMKFQVTDDGKSVVVEHVDGRQFKPTEHAWEQIARNCDVSITFVKQMQTDPLKQNGRPKYRRDKADMEVLRDVLNNGYRRLDRDKKFRFRTYSDGTMRAMLTDSYTIINNHWYLETLAELFSKDIGGVEPRLSHWKGNADTIYGNLLIPDTLKGEQDSDYGGMISMSNCEIGIRRLSQYPSIFRAICMNGCIWDQSKGNIISQVHRGEIDLRDLEKRIAMNIHTQLPLMGDAITRFMATRENELGVVKPEQAVVELQSTFGLTKGMKGEATEIFKQFCAHESDNKNMFGMINAITRAGQEFDEKTWVSFDEIAGTLLNYKRNQWAQFLSRAATRDNKAVAECFGLTV